MLWSENRYPPRIKSGAGLSGSCFRLTRLLVRLELRLQRRELGERRVRIGLVAPAAALAALDVFRPQFGIAVGTVAARRTTLAAIGTDIRHLLGKHGDRER